MRSRRIAIGALLLLGALALYLLSGSDEASKEPAARPTAAEPGRAPEALTIRPVEGAPCQVTGLVHDGVATRVRIHSVRAQIDVDATLLRDGRGFTADVPEQGGLHLVAISTDGRTAARRAVCSGEGRLEVELRFPPKDPNAATLTGRCTYLDTGAPVTEGVVRGSLAGAHGRVGALLWSGVSDDDGRFTISVPPGTFAVQCRKDGDDGDPVRVHLEPKGRASVELFVEAQAAVAGVVLDKAGGPVEGVVVSGRNAGARKVRRAVSDAKGRFVIRGLRPGAVVAEAHHDGRFAEGHTKAKVELPYAEVRLVLEDSTIGITGTVVGAEGPIPQATVNAAAAGRDAMRSPLSRSTLTGDDGTFTVGGLVAGTYRLSAQAPGYSQAQTEVKVYGGVVAVSLHLEKSCVTRVRVMPAEPIRPVTVSVRPKQGEPMEASGETGSLLELKGAGGAGVVVARTVGGAIRTATRAVTLCGASPVEIDFLDDEGTGAIVASVRDRDGAPVAGVRVWVEDGEAGPTGTDGEVRFEGLSPRKYWVGVRDVEPVRVEVQAGLTVRAELTVGREAGRITGTVVADRSPVEGARVLAACADSGRDRGLEGASVVARSGADGGFSFEPRDGGVCTVRAEHDRHGRSRLVTLKVNGPAAEISLRASGSISGRVTTGEGGPALTQYTVTARSLDRAGELETRTVYVSDPSGAYRVDDVAPGRVSVSVTADGGRAHREVELGSGEARSGVDLSIFRMGEVKGRILSPEGTPIFNARILVRALGAARGRVATGTDGRFNMKVPAGDPLRVFVRADGYYPWGSQPFDLQPDGPTDMGDVTLDPRGGPEEKEGGIGIAFSGDPRGARVIDFTASSPAREAGMEVGDLITAIDGVPAGREPIVNWVVNLRGPPDTPVVLEVERGTMAPFTVTVIRRSIGLDPVP